MKDFEGKTGDGLFRAEGEIAILESSRVDVPIEALNTYVGLYELKNSALKTLQVKLQGNDLARIIHEPNDLIRAKTHDAFSSYLDIMFTLYTAK